MRNRILCLALYALTALPFSHDAFADELLLLDGSRIVGKVVKKEHNTLEFETSFAGIISVDWDQVSELRTEEPAKVLLSDDTVISAQVFRNSADGTDVGIAPDAPARRFEPADIAYINPEPWRMGRGFKFTGRANFALDSDRGNTDKDEIDIDGELLWRRKKDRFIMLGELEHDKNNGTTTTDKWKLNGKYNYFTSSKRYYGGFLFADRDEFAELALRVGGGPGIGYQMFDSDELNLSMEAGPMRVYEDFKTQESDRYWAGGWLINFDKYVLPRLFKSYHLQVYHINRGLWNLHNTDNLIWDTWTGLRFPLAMGLVASTELKVEYNSGAAPGADKTDTTYRLKLGYQW